MRTIAAVLVALSLALGGCGDDDDTTEAAPDTTEQPRVGDIPACEDLYAEGSVVTLEQVEQGCLEEDGEHSRGGVTTIDCEDGRALMWNDHAWWYEGEGVTPHAEDAEELTAPAEEQEACEG